MRLQTVSSCTMFHPKVNLFVVEKVQYNPKRKLMHFVQSFMAVNSLKLYENFY
jgi:hypothetical protein